MATPISILSWNVNGLRAVERKGALGVFEAAHAPDVLFLQEIKGCEDQFAPSLVAHPDYMQYYHSAAKPGYAGTGIWVRRAILNTCSDVVFDTHVPDLVAADEGRVSHLRVTRAATDFSFLSVYFPNGGKSPQAWQDKLVFYDQLLAYIDDLHAQGRIVVIGGDMNVAHQPIDLARPRENDGKIGFHPDERAWMDRVAAAGWVDTWRVAHPDEVRYSWWDQKTRARERGVGWRIDYLFVHRDHVGRVTDTAILDDVTGSDHCPVGLMFALDR